MDVSVGAIVITNATVVGVSGVNGSPRAPNTRVARYTPLLRINTAKAMTIPGADGVPEGAMGVILAPQYVQCSIRSGNVFPQFEQRMSVPSALQLVSGPSLCYEVSLPGPTG